MWSAILAVVAIALVGCRSNPCPNEGGDPRARCLVEQDVMARVAEVEPQRAAFASQLAAMLADQPLTCGTSTASDWQHPSIQKVKTELAPLARASGIDAARVKIVCPQNELIIAETGSEPGTSELNGFVGVFREDPGRRVQWGVFGTDPEIEGVQITTSTSLPRHTVEVEAFYRL